MYVQCYCLSACISDQTFQCVSDQCFKDQPCALMVEGDDAKFKVVDNCMETLLKESNFQIKVVDNCMETLSRESQF